MSGPLKEWFSAQELADLRLRHQPRTKFGWRKIIEREGWEARAGNDGEYLIRERGGRGGGQEFHWSLLPSSARAEMVRRGIVVERVATPPSPAEGAGDRWAAASEVARERARERLAIVNDMRAMMSGGSNRDHAVSVTAMRANVSRASIYGWLSKVAGEPRHAWLELLLCNMKGGSRRAEIHPDLWSFYESWWLRQSKPTHADSYRRTLTEAKRLGIANVASAKTFQRRAEALPPEIVALKRGGPETARLLVPALERSVDGMHAMQVVDADGHKWDFEVRFPDGTTGRPMSVAVQDIASRKFLAWRHGKSESTMLVRLAFVDVFRRWGFPQRVLLDNGRAFASKWFTGGVANRYRNRILPGDPLGLLPRFNIEVQWALPKRGSSKPIERAFGDFSRTIARHPAFDGAYLGNNVLNKPENYRQRVVEWDEFVDVVNREIREHNARTGRDTEMAAGRSFDEAFAESYSQVPIARATEAQLRMCLLSADKVRAERSTGAVRLFGNRYWSPEMPALAGRQLSAYYDPDDLHSEIHLHDEAGAFLLTAPIWAKTGFLTEDHGRARMKTERDMVKNARKQIELRELYSAQELAHRAALAATEDLGAADPVATVVRPVRPIRTRGALAVAAAPAEEAITVDPHFADRFAAAMERRHLRLIEDE